MTGPGVSTFYFDEAASGFVADVVGLFDALKAYIPAGTTITVDNVGDLIDVDTGELSGQWTDAAAGPVVTSGAGAYSQGVGLRLTWLTSGIRNGRRVRGSTFIVPVIGGAYDATGTPNTTAMTTFSNAASAYMTAIGTTGRIYSRPLPGLVGQASTITSGSVPDAVSWLRTRRT